MIYAPKVSSKYTKKGLQVGKQQIEKSGCKLAEGEVIDIFATN
jgi:large subunit ribosomal protein L23